MTMFEYALSMLGTHYVWGGNTPDEGLDCSGYMCEVLRAYGHIDNQDYNAKMLHRVFLLKANKTCPTFDECESENFLVFYGEDEEKITHVGMFNQYYLTYVESGGEGRQASTKGFVRVRPIDHRDDIVAMIGVENGEVVGKIK